MDATERRRFTTNNGRRIRPLPILGMVLSLLGLAISGLPPTHAETRAPQAPQATDCQSGVGGRVFSNGGVVEVEILPIFAGFTSELNFVSPGPTRFIGTNRDAGTKVQLGSFPAGVELIFSIFVRATQKTFVMGSGSGNPDGLPHAEVTCFGGGTSNIGFEDQVGGGDRNFADLICAVRQPLTSCTYSLSPPSQSFGSGGGTGTVSVNAVSGCSWSAASNVSWVTITSGTAGSDTGTINYAVALNTNTASRTGTIKVQEQTFNVFQDGASAVPVITSAVRNGKKLMIYGLNFDGGSVLLLNDEKQKTNYDDVNPSTVLIGKKAGRWVLPGDKLRVRNSAGDVSPEYTYAP
jgi:Viral BACON domain